MPNHYHLLVFDWDGTIMDSRARIVASAQASIAALGLPARSPNQIASFIGLGLKEAVMRLFPEISTSQCDQLMAYHRHHFLTQNTLSTPLFPGVAETLQHLQAAGYWLAVATGKSRRGLNQALMESGLTTLFHVTRCAEETASKPNPQMLQEIMAELEISPSNTLMIGDTEYDLQMAENAGVASVAVSYGVHEKDHLLTCCRPLVCLDNLSALPAWLKD